MVRRLRRRAGYTLMEAMLVVTILGIIASVSAGMLIGVNRYFLLTRTKVDIQRQGRSILYVITRELRQAQSNSIVIDRASTSQPFYSRITFNKVIPSTGTAQTTQWMQFEQVGNELIQRAVPQGAPANAQAGSIVLTNNLNYLAFTFPRSDDMTIVSVSLTLQEATYQGQEKALHMASEQCQVMN